MRKALTICSVLLVAGLSVVAQEHGSAASAHSNAPDSSRTVSTDRDKGQDRAADVGKGKKKGLKKHDSKKHSKS